MPYLSRRYVLPTMLFGLALASCDDEPAPPKRPAPGARVPEVESVPSTLHSCTSRPRPQVISLPQPTSPVQVTVVRARHLCLGEFAALFRLEGTSERTVTQVVLDREWWSQGTGRPPRRDAQVVTKTFERGTVRYVRIRWREGLENRGERTLRVRIGLAHHAEGPPFEAGPWPADEPPRPDTDQGLADKLQKVRTGVQDVTRKIRKVGARLEAHPLVRHRPGPESPPRR